MRRMRKALVAAAKAVPGVENVSVNIVTKVISHAVQRGVQLMPNVKNIIAVASGKGGVGKSTTAANLALALAAEGATVGLLDADIYGPSQPMMLGIDRRPESDDGKTMEPLENHGVQVMSIGFLVDQDEAMIWRGPMATQALEQLLRQTNWKDLDYLIVDMPPGTGDIQLTLSQRVPMTGAVIVTTPQDIALLDAKKGIKMFEKVGVPILGIVENMAVHVCSNCGHAEHIFGEDGGKKMARVGHGLPRRAAAGHQDPPAGRQRQAHRGGRPRRRRGGHLQGRGAHGGRGHRREGEGLLGQVPDDHGQQRHLTRAAQACHITQPALSNALRALEGEFGVLIVKRGRAFEGFTVEGEAVLATAQRMLQEQELLRERLRSEAGQPRGRLRLAAVPTGMTILSRFAIALQKRHPGVAPTVVSLSSLEIETALDSMSLDLALGYTDRTRVRHQAGGLAAMRRDLLPGAAQAGARLRRAGQVRIGEPVGWAEAGHAAAVPAHARHAQPGDRRPAFKAAGLPVDAAMETNSDPHAGQQRRRRCAGLGAAAGRAGTAVARRRPLRGAPLVAPLLETPSAS
jgi:Mrp family chromosome partitioning ATPase/DNA-binding transcriptional LysR family regulator